jgi:uroporphyrinogen decarboxylase
VKETGTRAFTFDYAADVALVKAELGDSMCLVGNVDPSETLLMGTPDRVRREAQECIDKGWVGGGFVLGAGCDIGIETPIENVKALIETSRLARYAIG